jgi:hypothetical protein
LFFQSHQTLGKEAFAPPANDLTAAVETGGNFVVAQSLGGQQDHLGALDLKIR